MTLQFIPVHNAIHFMKKLCHQIFCPSDIFWIACSRCKWTALILWSGRIDAQPKRNKGNNEAFTLPSLKLSPTIVFFASKRSLLWTDNNSKTNNPPYVKSPFSLILVPWMFHALLTSAGTITHHALLALFKAMAFFSMFFNCQALCNVINTLPSTI